MGSLRNLRRQASVELKEEKSMEERYRLSDNPTFEARLRTFIEGSQKIIDEDHERHGHQWTPDQLTVERCPRAARLRVVSVDEDGVRTCWCFIDLKNGDVLFPASWKGPAKHPRGNIFDSSNGLSRITPHGPKSLKR